MKRTGAHDPVAILADPHARAGLLELKVLEEFDAVCKLGILLQAPLALADQPVGEGARGGGAGDCVDGDVGLGGELHVGISM